MSATDTATISRRRITHELKTWPQFFNATRNGEKRFELRRNDRIPPFQVGDQLLLKEWNPPKPGETHFDDDFHYTGRELLVRVDYIMTAAEVDTIMGLRPPSKGEVGECVIMSISHVN